MDYESIKASLQHIAKEDTSDGIAAIMSLKWLESMECMGRLTEALADPALEKVVSKSRLKVACGWKDPELLTVYCDGSCLNNGAAGARAGYGVYVTKKGAEVHRYSSRVPSDQSQTNQRAELLALQYSLNYVAESGQSAEIYTDSRYAMDCIMKWGMNWKLAGWKKADGKPIQHLDVIQSCIELFEGLGDRVMIGHISAHTGLKDEISVGNSIVDELARAAASGPSLT